MILEPSETAPKTSKRIHIGKSMLNCILIFLQFLWNSNLFTMMNWFRSKFITLFKLGSQKVYCETSICSNGDRKKYMPDDWNFLLCPMITLEGLKPLPSARKFLTMLRSIWGRKHGWVLGVCLWGACGFAYRKSRMYVFQWSAWNVQFPRKTSRNMVHLASIYDNDWDCGQ